MRRSLNNCGKKIIDILLGKLVKPIGSKKRGLIRVAESFGKERRYRFYANHVSDSIANSEHVNALNKMISDSRQINPRKRSKGKLNEDAMNSDDERFVVDDDDEDENRGPSSSMQTIAKKRVRDFDSEGDFDSEDEEETTEGEEEDMEPVVKKVRVKRLSVQNTPKATVVFEGLNILFRSFNTYFCY